MSTAVLPFAGTYNADPIHSSFGFAVRYQGVSLYRGSLDDITATVTSGDQGVSVQGAAKVESISIRTPEQFRAHVLSPEFFDAESHPEITFTSTSVDVADGGEVTLEGDLTIKGITRPVSAKGLLTTPAADAFGNTRGNLTLEATIDRTAYDMNWNMPLPSGGNALANEVTLTVDASLVAAEA